MTMRGIDSEFRQNPLCHGSIRLIGQLMQQSVTGMPLDPRAAKEDAFRAGRLRKLFPRRHADRPIHQLNLDDRRHAMIVA